MAAARSHHNIPFARSKIGSTNSVATEKSGDNEKDKENIGGAEDGEQQGHPFEVEGAEMDGMIFDFPAIRTLCLFTDQQNQLPIEPWHHYKPNISLNLTARYSSVNEISYVLNVQNTSFHMVHNLTVAVAFQPLPFFDCTAVREGYQPHEILLSRAYIDILYSGSTEISVLDLKKPIFPPFLVTFSTTSGIPPPTTSPSQMKLYLEKVIHEVGTKNINFMKLMRLQHSYVVTHLDAIITYETYKRIRHTGGHEYPTMILGRKEPNEDVPATAAIPVDAAKVIWGASYNTEKIYETFVPSASPRKNPLLGYLLVKGVFVEINFSVYIDAKNVNIAFVTPIRSLTLYLQKEIQVKFNSLCLLGNHVKPCSAQPLNYMEEKELIENGAYTVEDYTCLNNMKLLHLLQDELEQKKSEDEKD